MKRGIIVIAVSILIAISLVFLVAPAFKVVKLNEDLPPAQRFTEFMDEETKADFDQQVASMADKIVFAQEEMDDAVVITSEVDFQEAAHGVQGRALLIDNNGQKILRFEDFNTINGPQLNVYLSSDLDNDDFIDLGPLKATRGNFNYILEDIDTDKYNNVLVWCVPFGVIFSYAELS